MSRVSENDHGARGPRQKNYHKHRHVKPEVLDVVEFGGEVALEIVLDDEHAEKVGIAAGAEDVPGKSGEAEGDDGGGVKKTERVAPAFGEKRPEKNSAAAENHSGGTFGKNCQPEKKSEEEKRQPGCAREDGSVLVFREAKDIGCRDHGDGEHAAEGHVCGGGVGEADHADGGRQKEQEPARGLRAVEAKSEASHRERSEEGGDCAGQASRGFAHAEEFEAQRAAPIVERWLFEPRFSIQARGYPVAGFGHVARDPGVTWLIGTDEADGAEVAEVADVERRRDEDGPADPRSGIGPGFFSNLVGRFSHGNVSLVPFQLVGVNCRNPIAESLGQFFPPSAVFIHRSRWAASELLKQALL